MEDLKEDISIKHIKQFEEQYPTISAAYKKIMQEQYALTASKMLDYGMGNIAAGTPLATEEEKQFALTGLFFRINDKINRWKNLIVTKSNGRNESLSDTYQDLTNYGIITQIVDRGLWKK